MSRILTQAEMDALISATGSAGGGRAAGPGAPPPRPYNFRRPDRIAKDQLRTLRVTHDRWTKAFATALSAFLRAPVELTIVSVDQFSYAECLSSLADPTAFYALSLAPFEDAGALDVTPTIAYALVDRLLGGAGRATLQNRAMTEIELKVLDRVVVFWLESLTEIWKPTTEATLTIRNRETEPAMLQVAAPDAAFVVIGVDTRIGDIQGLVSLCLPVAFVESGRGASAPAWRRQQPAISPVERGWIQDNLGRVVVPVSLSIETSLAGRDVLALDLGDLISLGVPIAESMDVRVGGAKKLRGRLTARDNRVMVQVVGNPLSA